MQSAASWVSSNSFISDFKKDGKVKKLSEIVSVLSVKKAKISVGFSTAFQLAQGNTTPQHPRASRWELDRWRVRKIVGFPHK